MRLSLPSHVETVARDWNQAQNCCSLHKGPSPLNKDICLSVSLENCSALPRCTAAAGTLVHVLMKSACPHAYIVPPDSRVGVLWVWSWIYKHFVLLKGIRNTKFSAALLENCFKNVFVAIVGGFN